MEPDSTTVESDCYDFNETVETGRDSPLVDELLRYEGFFESVLKPMLKKEKRNNLLSWMKDNNLIHPTQRCPKDLPGCEMIWTSTRVVDGFQWKCKGCNSKLPIRVNSFFNFIYCTFSISFHILLAWCQDVHVGSVATAFGIKKQIVNKLYDKIEKIVIMRNPVPLGGPGHVVLVEIYPDTIGEQLQPDSSKNDSSPIPKQPYKILCLADTTQIPTRYWLHMISGHISVQTENNNTKIQKVTLRQEIMSVLDKYIAPGSYCAVAGGQEMVAIHEELTEKGRYSGVINTNVLISQSNNGMKSFLTHDIWKWGIKLCDAALELPKNSIQPYLSCCTWRRDVVNEDVFLSLLKLIADHDHTKKYPKKKKSSSSLSFLQC